MTLSSVLFGRGSSSDHWDLFFSNSNLFPTPSSSLSSPDHPSFTRDIAAVANTQVDWKETADSLIVKANLPGLSKEEVKVQVDDIRVLQISGERKTEETSSSDRWHRVERAQGSFLRRFRLPDNAKIEEVKASMETVPKSASPEPKTAIKTIDVSA